MKNKKEKPHRLSAAVDIFYAADLIEKHSHMWPKGKKRDAKKAVVYLRSVSAYIVRKSTDEFLKNLPIKGKKK